MSTQLSATDMRFLMSLNLSDPKDCKRYSDWLKQQDKLRTACEFRAGVTYDQEDSMPDYTPIDPYAPALARIRAA